MVGCEAQDKWDMHRWPAQLPHRCVMTQSKSNSIQKNAETVHNFVWTGRNDLEDGALGTRVHHITKQVQSNDLSSELTDGTIALVGFATILW